MQISSISGCVRWPNGKIVDRAFVLMGLFVAIMFWRSPDLLLSPRFWGEEGAFYYAALQDGSATPFNLIVRGNFQLILNLGVWMATFVPAVWAAHVTTYFGLILALGCIWLLGKFSIEQRWSATTSAFVVLAIALLPQGYEVFLSTNNQQWLCSLSLFIVCLISWDELGRKGKVVLYGWVVLCSLSGVPCALVTPFLFVRGVIARSKVHIYIGLILLVGAWVLGIVIFTHSHPDRVLAASLVVLTAPLGLQTIVSPLLTAAITERLIAILRHASIGHAVCAYLMVSSVFILTVLGAMNKPNERIIVFMLAAAWMVIPSLQVFGSIGDPSGLISGWVGGRYFFFGAVCFILLLGMAANTNTYIVRNLATMLIVMCCLSGAYQVKNSDWKDWMIHGPSWRDEIAACNGTRPCIVHAWPRGTDWKFDLKVP